MKILTSIIIFMSINILNAQSLKKCKDKLSSWDIVNDDVMGGRSVSYIDILDNCNVLFTGEVSLENNGGFASTRYYPNQKTIIKNNQTIILKLKGDGKNYQFRIKLKDGEYFSYIVNFSTSNDFEEIRLPISSFYPSFRGRKLANSSDVNLNGQVEYFSILISNKKAESFSLEIESISI